MSVRELADPKPVSSWIDADTLGNVFGFLNRTLRPSDGWLSLIFLSLNLVVVVLSVEQADWVPTPSLVGVLLLAMVTALLLYRLPVWPGVTFLLGLVVGLAFVIWQMSSYQVDGQTLGGADELRARLELWFDATRSGSINIDKVPFAFGLMIASWLTGYLGAWLFLRYRNFLGGGGGGVRLGRNRTVFQPYLSAAQYQLLSGDLPVHRASTSGPGASGPAPERVAPTERNVRRPFGSLTLSDSFFLTVAVVLIAFLLPVGGRWATATDAYESMRTPWRRGRTTSTGYSPGCRRAGPQDLGFGTT